VQGIALDIVLEVYFLSYYPCFFFLYVQNRVQR
jgi:hypothetical protein